MRYQKYIDLATRLSGIGLNIMGKSIGNKFPTSTYWSSPYDSYTVEDVIADLQAERVDGICVRTGIPSGGVVVLDFDPADLLVSGYTAGTLAKEVQRMCPTKFIIQSPTGGFHFYYRVTDGREIKSKVPFKGLDVKGEGGLVVVGAKVRYTGDNAVKKGVPDGFEGEYGLIPTGEYHLIPEMNDTLYNFIYNRSKGGSEGERFGLSEVGRKKVERHLEQTTEAQTKVVLEALEYVLEGWGSRSYDEWVQMWMSAHHGSNGAHEVRDFIINHPDIEWGGFEGIVHFESAWAKFDYREGGYTVASLFWLARKAGWLGDTGYELPEAETIHTQYVQDWFDKLESVPDRLLLMSQTGSGKTHTLVSLWERLGKGKAVVFVPSIKLATELAYTLQKRGVPATLYRHDETGEIAESDTYYDAEFMVTTLQSFGSRMQDSDMSEYDLVYFEESDQLFSQFARGGGGVHSSHVSEKEAQKGFDVIRKALLNAKVVWCVDATMSLVTYKMVTSYLDVDTVRVVRNTYITEKAPVAMVGTKDEALAAIVAGLESGNQVVTVVDTAKQGQDVWDLVTMLLPEKKTLLIIGDTDRQPDTVQFMRDVNTGARHYDLVIYNSVMASGVSITDIQPDLIVQIGGYLTPRNNLQLLNRYRKQTAVVCYYRMGEELYGATHNEVLQEALTRLDVEASLVSTPVVARSTDAEIRSTIAAISVADEYQQNRAPREYYIGLLKGDGRVVRDAALVPQPHLEEALELLKEVRKGRSEAIKNGWRSVPPINTLNPAKPEYTVTQVAQGLLHDFISESLQGNIPTDVADGVVAETVLDFGGKRFMLSALLDDTRAVRYAEALATDSDRAVTSVQSTMSTLRLAGAVKHLFPVGITERGGENDLNIEQDARAFLKRMENLKDVYNSVVRPYQSYSNVCFKNENEIERAFAFAKIILARFNIKVRSVRGAKVNGVQTYLRVLDNLRQAEQFLLWRAGEDADKVVIDFEKADREVTTERKEAVVLFNTLSDEQKAMVINLTTSMSFDEAVGVVMKGIVF